MILFAAEICTAADEWLPSSGLHIALEDYTSLSLQMFSSANHVLLAFEFLHVVYTGGTPRTHEHETVAVELFITYSILSGMGIVFAAICLVFNLVFRNKM